jgi:hypothetical protein
MLNEIDVFLFRAAIVGLYSALVLLLGFYLGRQTRREIPEPKAILKREQSGTRDTGSNPFTDSLKPPGLKDRIPTTNSN